MNKRTARRIACGLAADLLDAELSNQAMWESLGYMQPEMNKIHDAMEELIGKLDRRYERDDEDTKETSKDD